MTCINLRLLIIDWSKTYCWLNKIILSIPKILSIDWKKLKTFLKLEHLVHENVCRNSTESRFTRIEERLDPRSVRLYRVRARLLFPIPLVLKTSFFFSKKGKRTLILHMMLSSIYGSLSWRKFVTLEGESDCFALLSNK